MLWLESDGLFLLLRPSRLQPVATFAVRVVIATHANVILLVKHKFEVAMKKEITGEAREKWQEL